MNRCFVCGRKLKNSETTCGIEFCEVCEKYEQQLEDKGKEIGNLVRRLLATTYKDEELAIYKRALELACRRIDYLTGDEDSEYMTDPFTFILLAKEELKDLKELAKERKSDE